MKLIIACMFLSVQIFSQSLTVEIEELPTSNKKQQKIKKPTVLMIDDFEDADLTKFREWWTFDKVMIKSKNIEEKKKVISEMYHYKLVDPPITGTLGDLAFI